MSGDGTDRAGSAGSGDRPVTSTPWSFSEAVTAARRAAEAQKAGEQAVRDASASLADAERAYRLSLAKEIVRQHADGVAWTVAKDLARGAKEVGELRYARDVAAGVFKAADQRAWRDTANRKDVLLFSEWSKRRDLAEGGAVGSQEPAWTPRAA